MRKKEEDWLLLLKSNKLISSSIWCNKIFIKYIVIIFGEFFIIFTFSDTSFLRTVSKSVIS